MGEILDFADARRRRRLAPPPRCLPILLPIGKQPGDFVRDRRTGIAGAVVRIMLVEGDGEAALKLILHTSRGAIVTLACHVDPIDGYEP